MPTFSYIVYYLLYFNVCGPTSRLFCDSLMSSHFWGLEFS